MKYFLHDCNAFDDEKISELFINFGYEGIGLFYTILEKIGKQEKPIKTTVLKAQLKVGKRLEKCWKFMEEIGIINTSNGETFNERILSYSESYSIKKEKTRKRISEWRENQEVAKNVTSYKEECNHSKVKESKVKESKEREEDIFLIEDCLKISLKDNRWVDANKVTENDLLDFNKMLEKRGVYSKNPLDYKTHYSNWKGAKKEPEIKEYRKPLMDQTLNKW